MKLKNDHGFLQLIAYLLIFGIFALTLYACLDILNLIEVPEEYSVANWLAKYSKETVIEVYEANDESSTIQNITKQIKSEISDTNSLSGTIQSPEVEGYQTSQTNTVKYEVSPVNEYSYYYQLDDYAKIIYQGLEKNLDNMKSGTYKIDFGTTFDDLLHEENGEEILNNSFQLAINALNFDKPDLFYIDISKLYLLSTITTRLWSTTYEVAIGGNNGESYLNSTFANQNEVNQAVTAIQNERAKIKSNLSGSIENQIRTVHDYLIDNLEYDNTLSKSNIYNIYGALINRSTVCEGYARAFKYIMDDLKIPCLIACGTAQNSAGETESHAWNYVRLDGNWYAIDVTWDDPIIIGYGYISNDVNYKYYLKGSNDFFTNHTEDGKIVGTNTFSYPVLSTTNYEK